MIRKYVKLDKEDLFKKVGNILNKVAESMDTKDDIELVSQYQPEDSAQDTRLLNDAFKTAVKTAVRKMAPYIDNSEDTSFSLDPKVLNLGSEANSQGIIRVTATGEWMLSVSSSDNTNPSLVILLAFPDTWLDVDVLQDYVEEFVTTQMIASYLESVDKRHAEWYRHEADDKAHDIVTTCAMRKPGTRYGVQSVFGESW